MFWSGAADPDSGVSIPNDPAHVRTWSASCRLGTVVSLGLGQHSGLTRFRHGTHSVWVAASDVSPEVRAAV